MWEPDSLTWTSAAAFECALDKEVRRERQMIVRGLVALVFVGFAILLVAGTMSNIERQMIAGTAGMVIAGFVLRGLSNRQ